MGSESECLGSSTHGIQLCASQNHFLANRREWHSKRLTAYLVHDVHYCVHWHNFVVIATCRLRSCSALLREERVLVEILAAGVKLNVFARCYTSLQVSYNFLCS